MDGNELKRRRGALGLSQKELAAALGVKPNTISRYENDRLTIPKLIVVAIEGLECKDREKGKFSK